MSMWEIESLVETGVQFVASQQQLSVQERRSYYASLYTLQKQFDCSYTHFRCIDVLERDRFLFHVPIEQHPAYEKLGEALREKAEATSWITMDPDDGKSPTAGIYTSPKGLQVSEDGTKSLYFDVLSPMWKHGVDAGTITGEAAKEFETWGSVDTVARMMLLAADAPDLENNAGARATLKGFYGFGGLYLAYEPDPPAPGNPLLDRALAHPHLASVVTKPVEDWIDKRFPVPTLPAPDESGYVNPDFVAFWRAGID